MTVFCWVYSSTLTLDGGKPRSISTDGTVSPTLMVFLPKGPAAAVGQRQREDRAGAACYALLLLHRWRAVRSRRLRCVRLSQMRHARDAATVSRRGAP